jgi:hypothetical protein
MLAVFTLKDAIPPFFFRENKGTDVCFRDSKLKFHHPHRKGNDFARIIAIFFPIDHTKTAAVSLFRWTLNASTFRQKMCIFDDINMPRF